MNNQAQHHELRLKVLRKLMSGEQHIRVFLYVRYPTI
jgi:hypothetical protein